jgi:hypothetical protein
LVKLEYLPTAEPGKKALVEGRDEPTGFVTVVGAEIAPRDVDGSSIHRVEFYSDRSIESSSQRERICDRVETCTFPKLGPELEGSIKQPVRDYRLLVPSQNLGSFFSSKARVCLPTGIPGPVRQARGRNSKSFRCYPPQRS